MAWNYIHMYSEKKLLNDRVYFPDSLTTFTANQISYMSWIKFSIQISEWERN